MSFSSADLPPGAARGAAVAVCLWVTLVAACRPPLPATEASWRAEREQAVRRALPEDRRASFPGLVFFPYDPAYRFRAMLEPVFPPESLTLGASDGSLRPAARVGRLRLRFPAGEAVLTVFQLLDIRDSYPNHYFLPFRDALAGKETYGAGRYLEVSPLGAGVVEVDFNRAYNPDCAYGITARCPITPEENTLPFAVPVGERLPPGH
ncbi:MAG: DUF1684 domain-containing protein [Acidobacteriota bacterium]|jgi:hypothetical protein